MWKASFGVNNGGDTDNDGDTDGDDFLVWQSQFGSSAGNGAVASVPEPISAVLLLLGCTAITIFARRRQSC